MSLPPPTIPDVVKKSSPFRRTLAILVTLLLLIFISRVVRLNTLDMNKDEVWTVWQTFGSVQDIVRWTPYDWPPGFYLTVGGWQWLMSIHPFTLRLLPIFIFLISVALLYAVAKKLHNRRTGLMAIVVYSALGYSVYLSTMLRGYILVLAFWLLALWLALYYFEQKRSLSRPSILLGLGIAGCLAAMFYVHVSAVFGIALLLLYTAILYGRRVWRWWLPLLVSGVLMMPEVLAKQAFAVNRIAGNPLSDYPINLLATWIQRLYIDLQGRELTLWFVFMLIATLLILDKWRLNRRVLGLAVWILSPVPSAFIGIQLGSFNARHLPWMLCGIALWIGWGLSMLPRAAALALSLVMAAIMFQPIPLNQYELVPRVPLVTLFNWMSHVARPSDVVVLDPRCEACAFVAPEEWDYFAQVYFPNGIRIVREPDHYSRVWYLYANGNQDATLAQSLEQDCAASLDYNNQQFNVRLYETPPDREGILFENGLRFNGAEILDDNGISTVWRQGEVVHIRLWWSIDRQIEADYSVGTYFLNADGSLADSTDTAPQLVDGPPQTSQWVTGRYYLEERTLKLPATVSAKEIPLYMAVYQARDGKRLTAPGMNADNLLVLKQIALATW
ncbi:MAG: glycosyltransferase family 39 protein [Chloroflexota bacterium]